MIDEKNELKPHLLITSGPTREYWDPVRYLSNASSGRMGAALAVAALEADFRVSIVSGPVEVTYPSDAAVYSVVSTDRMLETCLELFPDCQMVIGAAAPCDFKPKTIFERKIKKNHDILLPLELVETVDIMAELGKRKKNRQLLIPFALETHFHHACAMEKLNRKNGDYILLNDPSAIANDQTDIAILDANGRHLHSWQGKKTVVARSIIDFLKPYAMSWE